MDSLARLISSNENAHTLQPSKNATIDSQTPRKGVLFAFKDVTNNKASSSTIDNLKSAKKSTPFGNKINKLVTPDSFFSLGPASPNLSNTPSLKLTPEIVKSVKSFINEDFYVDPDEFDFPTNGDCACCGSNRKSPVDKMYSDFMEAMSASPMLPTFEREIYSPFHIPELEYVSIETEDFPFYISDPIPVPNNYPTLNYSCSIGSNDYDESDEDESSSNNESNDSIVEFEHNFSAIDINYEFTPDSNKDGYETFSDNESNNSMANFELNFTDDSINPQAIEGLDSSFTGEW